MISVQTSKVMHSSNLSSSHLVLSSDHLIMLGPFGVFHNCYSFHLVLK